MSKFRIVQIEESVFFVQRRVCGIWITVRNYAWNRMRLPSYRHAESLIDSIKSSEKKAKFASKVVHEE